MAMVPHVVRAGDHLPRLAAALGVSADSVWNHPQNDDLRSLRKDMHILCPGDVLFLPERTRRWLPVNVGASNRFEAKIPTIPIRVTFTLSGKLLAGETCVVHELQPPNQFVTDGTGTLSFQGSVRLEFIRVTFPRLGLYQCLRIGHLNPADTESGVLQRLRNMGYVPAEDAAGESGLEMLQSALFEFQRAHDLPLTGELDDATRDKLAGAHGC